MHKLLIVISVICVGCAGLVQKMTENAGYVHATLRVPPATAPEADRIKTYANLRLETFSSLTANGYRQNSIILADGTKIFYFSDLLQTLPADSETAKLAKLAEDELFLSTKGGGRAALAFSGGLLLFMGSAAGAAALIVDGQTSQGIAFGAIGVSALTLGIVSLARYKRRYNKHAEISDDAIHRAAESYNLDLLNQLNLCFDARKVVFACEKNP